MTLLPFEKYLEEQGYQLSKVHQKDFNVIICPCHLWIKDTHKIWIQCRSMYWVNNKYHEVLFSVHSSTNKFYPVPSYEESYKFFTGELLTIEKSIKLI